MADERPQKKAVRRLWLEAVRRFLDEAGKEESAPLLLTLPGGAALDIVMLLEHGIVRRTEVGGIAKTDQWKVVAIESSPDAVRRLQETFPGLKILQQPIENLLRGDGLTTWPTGEHKAYCRAHVVNLDLNSPLSHRSGAFPIIDLIRKLAILHAYPPMNWVLLLTLHGEIVAENIIKDEMFDFLGENMRRDAVFAGSLASHLGERVISLLQRRPAAHRLSVSDQQRLMMVFVPKKISSMVHQDGWSISTDWNLMYGEGELQQAPIVSWILSFRMDPRGRSTPDALYRESLRSILRRAQRVEPNGSICK